MRNAARAEAGRTEGAAGAEVAATGVEAFETACFVAGTQVWTAEGFKAIEDIRPGDLVVSREAAGLRTTLKPVTRVFKRTAPGILRLTLESAAGEEETLSTTPEHPFHVVGRGFVAAADLGPGDLITAGGRLAQSPLLLAASKENDASGALKVKSLSLEDTAATVYNFEVADTHTYFVGRHKAWVHNTCSADDLVRAGGKILDDQTIIGVHGNKFKLTPAGTYEKVGPATRDEIARAGVELRIEKATQARAEANVTSSGQTVLGPYPGYVTKANARGASFFDLGDAWNDLSEAQRWAANKHFLDVIAERGDQVLLAVTKNKIRPGSYLEQEVKYLVAQKGYVWQNQWSLKPKVK